MPGGIIDLYRTVFFLPSIVPTVASLALFLWLLISDIGIVNGLWHGSEWSRLMAASTLLVLPIIVLFFMTQKTFI